MTACGKPIIAERPSDVEPRVSARPEIKVCKRQSRLVPADADPVSGLCVSQWHGQGNPEFIADAAGDVAVASQVFGDQNVARM